ncbi:metallophosphoesterase [Membranihabitans marinus]|uniref:metallophosphoesterase n=1 Tax=Membranihabitans marinus TaxID=1227546 RepID=UPI001F3BD1A2|nr:metallophosphoesterase [Membranihabitans marinus]
MKPLSFYYQRYKTISRGLTFLIIMYLYTMATISAQPKISQEDEDLFTIQLDRTSSPIVILQVTDMHLGSTEEGKWKRDMETFRRIKKLVDTYDVDMIAVTGDLFTGEKPFGALLVAHAVQFFDHLERPWLYVFGNHDPQGGFGRAAIAEVMAESKWAILGKHSVDNEWKEKYDYLVNINFKNEPKPAWQIFGFDSGSEKGYKSIKDDQLDWYKERSSQSFKKYKESTRAISIFHIPLIQYQYLQDDKTYSYQGIADEKVYYEEDDGRVYDTFLEVGNIEATFCGHDHYNNYWGKYKGGIILGYGFISGVSTKYAWPPGGKLITLPIDGGEIKIENVSPKMD